MGGRGASGNNATKTIIPNSGMKAKTVNDLPKIPEGTINAGKITKMAETTFKKTYYDSLDVLETWGDNNASGFQTLPHEDTLSRQALTGIQTLINQKAKRIRVDFQLGVIDYEKAERQTKALAMVQNTLNSQLAIYRKAGFIK